MGMEQIVQDISENLKKLGNLRNINIKLGEGPVYIEFILPDKKTDETAFTLYKRISKIIHNNYSQIFIYYKTPDFSHRESNIRRILIEFDENLKQNEKEDLLKKAAIDFSGVLKRLVKYGVKK